MSLPTVQKCPKNEDGLHRWVPYVERGIAPHRGEECRDCGFRPRRRDGITRPTVRIGGPR